MYDLINKSLIKSLIKVKRTLASPEEQLAGVGYQCARGLTTCGLAVDSLMCPCERVAAPAGTR
jgi:hypothetical protein